MLDIDTSNILGKYLVSEFDPKKKKKKKPFENQKFFLQNERKKILFGIYEIMQDYRY